MFWPKLCPGGTHPIAGSTFSLTANTYTSTSASTYGATDSPAMLNTIVSRSAMPFGLRADRSASGTASTSEIKNANATNSNVTGRSAPRIEPTL